jgi:hypothetical protein
MIKNLKKNKVTIKRIEHPVLKMQTANTSMQIECDIVKQKENWKEEALKFSKTKSENGKFRAIIIDPPYDNTGCKLGYLKLKDKEWIEAINFDELIDDGFIFI